MALNLFNHQLEKEKKKEANTLDLRLLAEIPIFTEISHFDDYPKMHIFKITLFQSK